MVPPTSGQRGRPKGLNSKDDPVAKGLNRMQRNLVFAVALAAMCLLSGPAGADAANGERLARQWCANCHVIDGSGPSARLPQGPPSFRVAARHLDTGADTGRASAAGRDIGGHHH
jgi:mono/diheme cytochrome c family protein